VDQDRVEVLLGEDGVLVQDAGALQLGRGLRDQRARRQRLQPDRVADHRPGAAQRLRQAGPAARAGRVGHDRAELVAAADREARTVQPGQERLPDRVLGVDEDHGGLARQHPAGPHRGQPYRRQVGPARQQQVDELVAAAFPLRHRLRLLPHVPAGGRGRELVHEGEYRLGQRDQPGRLDRVLEGGPRHVPPGDPPTDLVSGEQSRQILALPALHAADALEQRDVRRRLVRVAGRLLGLGQLDQPGQERLRGRAHLGLLVREELGVLRPLRAELLPNLVENRGKVISERGNQARQLTARQVSRYLHVLRCTAQLPVWVGDSPVCTSVTICRNGF